MQLWGYFKQNQDSNLSHFIIIANAEPMARGLARMFKTLVHPATPPKNIKTRSGC